jgi:hypothetical protein
MPPFEVPWYACCKYPTPATVKKRSVPKRMPPFDEKVKKQAELNMMKSMTHIRGPNRDDLLDMLLDLKHDLGKYIALPLSLLKKDADPGEVRKALEVALRQTRKGPKGVKSARDIWNTFLDEAQIPLSGYRAFPPLKKSVMVALSWESVLKGKSIIPRESVERDLRAVKTAIQGLINEVSSVQ